MKIKSIHLYSYSGQRRDLEFKLDGLNIITGRSSTGKSAIYTIIEYCMGSGVCTIPIGTITDKVSWYAVVFQINDKQVFIARPALRAGEKSNSQVMYKQGSCLAIPNYTELGINIDKETVVNRLSRLIGISDNKTAVPDHHSRPSYTASILHTHYYLFQEQNIVANKDQLFYRQNEQFIPQAIKDTFPILFRISSEKRYLLARTLRDLRRELKLKNKELENEENALNPKLDRARKLFYEAQKSGIIDSYTPITTDFCELIDILMSVELWRPDIGIDNIESTQKLNEEIINLRNNRRELQYKIDVVKTYDNYSSRFNNEVAEQSSRLASIKALPYNEETDEWQWPFCEKNLGMDSPIAKVLLDELSKLNMELSLVEGERVNLNKYLDELEQHLISCTDAIKAKEDELLAIISTNEKIIQLQDKNYVASQVVGKICYFLEELKTEDEISEVKNEISRIKMKIEEIESEIGEDNFAAKLASALNIISSKIGEYINQFDVEYSNTPVRFDLPSLTLIFDRLSGAVPMNRTGSAQNHLAMHISTMLALHSYASSNVCPIPSFLFIDQPSQVYFPSLEAYKNTGGSTEKTVDNNDLDLAKVTNLFKFLLNYTKKDNPGFQIIVTEHANLPDEWFQESLVEIPWSDPPALIPNNWSSINI